VSEHNSSSSVFRPAFVLMAGRALGFIALFALPIVLVRLFDQTEFGTYKQLFLIFGTLFLIAPLGMGGSLYYFMPRAPRGGMDYVANSLVVLTASGIASFALLWWNAGKIAAWLNNPDLKQYIPYIGAFLFAMLIAGILENLMIVRKQHGLAFWAYALSSILRAAFLIVPALIFRSLQALLIGAIAFAVLRLLTTFFYLRITFPTRPRFNLYLWKAHLAYAMPFALAVVIDVMQTRVHFYAVSSHFDAATFAIYSVGCLQVPLVDFFMTSTGNVMMVKMRENLSDGKIADTMGTWRDTTRKLALVFAPLVGLAIVVAHALILTLYTTKYAASVPIFQLWSVSLIFNALLTHSIMRVYAQTRFLIVSNLANLAVVALTITFLMGRLGLIGAVIAALLALASAKVLELWRSKVVMRCSMRELLPWRKLGVIVLIGAVSVVPAFAARILTNLPSIAELFLLPAIYVATYTGLLWRYGPIEPREKQLVIRTAHRLLVRCITPWSSRSRGNVTN
jgi:O-antigen/teichoic acid export membrane protein